MRNASFKLTYECVVSVCCVGFASLDVFVMNFMIVPRMLVCSSFLISVCMFIVSKALLISSAPVIVRTGEPFVGTPLLRCCLMCVVRSL